MAVTHHKVLINIISMILFIYLFFIFYFFFGGGGWGVGVDSVAQLLLFGDRACASAGTLEWRHNGAIASQITSLTIVYWTVYSDADQRKHRSSASLAFVRGIHRGPVNSTHKWPATQNMFPFDDVIMNYSRLIMICIWIIHFVIIGINNHILWFIIYLKQTITTVVYQLDQ